MYSPGFCGVWAARSSWNHAFPAIFRVFDVSGILFLISPQINELLLLTYTSLNGGRSHCSRRYRLPAGNCPCFRCDTKGFAQLGCGEARSIEPKEPDQPECCSALDGEGGEGGQGKDD
jgi:hypothetical protein